MQLVNVKIQNHTRYEHSNKVDNQKTGPRLGRSFSLRTEHFDPNALADLNTS